MVSRRFQDIGEMKMKQITASYFPKMTDLLKEICCDIAKNIIKALIE